VEVRLDFDVDARPEAVVAWFGDAARRVMPFVKRTPRDASGTLPQEATFSLSWRNGR